MNALIITAKDELAEAIKKMFYNALNPDSQYTEQMTAMVATSPDGQLEAVKLSKRNGPYPRLLDNYNKTTAFIRASRSGQISVVRVFLKKEVHFDLDRTARFTDLMAASLNGNTDIVKLLLEKGANPYLKDKEGKTALDYAGNPEIKNLLNR
jgi:ankyrin repeat protein